MIYDAIRRVKSGFLHSVETTYPPFQIRSFSGTTVEMICFDFSKAAGCEDRLTIERRHVHHQRWTTACSCSQDLPGAAPVLSAPQR